VIEFNARFGDPEAQAVLPLLESDLIELLGRAVDGRLAGGAPPRWREGAACAVCLASAGYPEAVRDGVALSGLEGIRQDGDSGALVFHAGTALRDGQLVTNGGRLLGVTATGATLAAARERAYAASDLIRIDGCRRRGDIALEAET